MNQFLSHPRTPKVLIASLTFWLLFGWAYGDDWTWTIIRALLATMTVVGIVALYATEHAIARIGRVAFGVILGAMCARILGGSLGAVIAVAAAFLIALLGCEYLVERERRSLNAS